ncbi:MAG: hypothetical protein OEV57_00880 [Dehalococcoidia bacterium]|nr:hypothetical protein [Dehalococcoidia bacterium]
MWRPKAFLAVTEESDRSEVDTLPKPSLEETFHEISRDTKVLAGEAIDDLHKPFTEYQDAIMHFVK